MWSVKCGVLVFLLKVVFGQLRIDPLVSTDVGLIRGLQADDGDYSMFLGIPFAQVDKSNPFGAASPYPEFKETFEAYDDSAVCPQIEEFNNTIVGSLDCLNLNVFVPLSATSSKRLPVLVWIHGGGYSYGFGNRYIYGPRFLIQHEIILVTVNYRLGLYGFMCLDTPEIPGNQGLKDQVLALRWIKRNIEGFGGDVNKITIFGESAGAMAVDMHLTSNNEKLYDKAILHSGTILSPVVREPIKMAPTKIAQHLGYAVDNNKDALQFLTNVDTALVIAAVDDLELNTYFRPCIEKEFDGVESIITQNWITAELPKVKKMPILIGFNSNEWYLSYATKTDDYYKNLDVISKQLEKGFDVDSADFVGMEDMVYNFYLGDEGTTSDIKQNIIDFESDFIYIHPTYRSVNKYFDNGAGNIFLYVFSHFGKRNFVRHKNNITDGTGATHADEISFLFDVSYMKDDPVTTEDEQIINQMTTMWTNFVKYGDPTPQTNDLLPVKWEPITNKSAVPYMDIDSPLSLGSRPFHERATFWDLFYKTNRHLQVAYPGANVNL